MVLPSASVVSWHSENHPTACPDCFRGVGE